MEKRRLVSGLDPMPMDAYLAVAGRSTAAPRRGSRPQMEAQDREVARPRRRDARRTRVPGQRDPCRLTPSREWWTPSAS